MEETEAVKDTGADKNVVGNKKPSKGRRVAATIGVAVLLVILIVLIINALLTLFMPHYYPTFGNYRLFSIVTDSMDPEIPKGHMIVSEVPKGETSIKVGDVITFEVEGSDGKITLLTHRVVEVKTNSATGKIYYTTKGDNAPANDSIHPEFEDVVGVFTGNHCAFFGDFFAFLQSGLGAMALFFIAFIVVVTWTVVAAYNRHEHRRKIATAALKKSADELSTVNLRYDNIREITAVMDVLGMVTDEPRTAEETRDVETRLLQFINAESIELPRNAETAAVLDSLPAPDTPQTLAAALRSGATLRQAEDGQTLVLTGMSGGKSILLTPVQTPDGIILCQQGVRIRSELAPNIEEMGATSMPEYPEFFEGKPLVHNVEYPELPQPTTKFNPVTLSPHGSLVPEDEAVAELPEGAAAMPRVAAGANDRKQPDGLIEGAEQGRTALPQHATDSIPVSEQRKDSEPPADRDAEADAKPRRSGRGYSRDTYAKYRAAAAQSWLEQAEQLRTLFDETVPLTPEEKERIAEIKAAKKKPSKPRKAPTPEQREARKAAAERRKAEEEAFISSLDPADRELYVKEKELTRARTATIRKLKRINADRKLLEKSEGE